MGGFSRVDKWLVFNAELRGRGLRAAAVGVGQRETGGADEKIVEANQ
jgi:hypothetical protein